MGKYVDSFKIFEAKYHTYADYMQDGDEWGTPEELKKDATILVKHMIPKDWDSSEDAIKNITDQSNDKKGIKFEFTLDSGDTITVFKVGRFRGSWEIYFNKKKVKDKAAVKKILSERMTDLDQYLHSMKGYDFTHQYADDARSRRSGEAHQKTLTQLYSKLSPSDKKKAYDKYKEIFKIDTKFNNFSGT